MPDLLRYLDFINEKESPKKGKVLFISLPESESGALERVNYHKYLESKLNCTFCLFKDLILMYVVAKSNSGKSYLVSSLL